MPITHEATVVVALVPGGDSIDRILAALERQDERNFELIIVDSRPVAGPAQTEPTGDIFEPYPTDTGPARLERSMTLLSPFLPLSLVILAALSPLATGQDDEVAESEVGRRVRREIAALPTYGVFDLLTVEVNEKGLVSLGGYAYDSSLPEAAEKAVKKVEGVREVANRIEVLPNSTSDEKIRREIYREIYLDSYLSRYGRADAPPSASRSPFSPFGPGYRREDPLRPPIWSGRSYPAQEPLGDYAIHVVVKKGNVLLGGAVNTLADKNAAAIKAGGVLGVHKVDNQLQVVPASPK